MAYLSDLMEIRARIRIIRGEVYGEPGIPALAKDLGIPPRTWENFEAGVAMPATVLLRFIILTGCDPHWLLTGEGQRFRGRFGSADRQEAN